MNGNIGALLLPPILLTMDSVRILLLLGALCGLAFATKLGEEVSVHETEKPTDEKTENVKRVSLTIFVFPILNITVFTTVNYSNIKRYFKALSIIERIFTESNPIHRK